MGIYIACSTYCHLELLVFTAPWQPFWLNSIAPLKDFCLKPIPLRCHVRRDGDASGHPPCDRDHASGCGHWTRGPACSRVLEATPYQNFSLLGLQESLYTKNLDSKNRLWFHGFQIDQNHQSHYVVFLPFSPVPVLLCSTFQLPNAKASAPSSSVPLTAVAASAAALGAVGAATQRRGRRQAQRASLAQGRVTKGRTLQLGWIMRMCIRETPWPLAGWEGEV